MTKNERFEAIGMLRALTIKDVAAHFNVDRRTIGRLKSKFNHTGDVSDHHRSGRPRKTTAAEDREIRTTHLRDRFKSAKETSRNWIGNNNISSSTVLRRLASQGLRCRRPVVKQRLTDQHRATRLEWATRHRRWTLRQWSDIIFSDEKLFVIDKKNSRKRCFRRKNERFHQPNIHEYGPRRGIMVWAAISVDGKSDLIRFNGNVTAIRYQNEALQPALIPFANGHNRPMVFQQDNAPAHRAFATRDWLTVNNIRVFGPWPANSPDMNPIENLWVQLERALERRPTPPANEAQLWRALQEEWANINMWNIRRLVLSMRRRCTALVEAAGGYTCY